MKPHITRLITGIGIIIIGVILLLSNLGVASFGQIVNDWWPLIIIGAGIIMFLNDVKNYLWAILVTGVGIALQLRELNITDINVFQLFWPAVIVVVGLSIILNRMGSARKISKENSDDVSAILSGIDHKNNSDMYEGGHATAVMGGIKLDLRKAVFKNEANLNVFVFMGGIELWVPENVIVKTQAACIAGGMENKSTPGTVKDAPVLYVTGNVIMGGVEIKT